MKKSKVSVRGQTVIPQEIREALGIKPNTEISWSARDGVLIGLPIPEDPIAATRGMFKGMGPSTDDLLEERRKDLELEQRKLAPWLTTRPRKGRAVAR